MADDECHPIAGDHADYSTRKVTMDRITSTATVVRASAAAAALTVVAMCRLGLRRLVQTNNPPSLSTVVTITVANMIAIFSSPNETRVAVGLMIAPSYCNYVSACRDIWL